MGPAKTTAVATAATELDERPQPRAAGAGAGGDPRHGGLRRGLHRSLRTRSRTSASSTAATSSGSAWRLTCSCASGSRTPTRTCFPLCALLAAIGLVVIYRIDDQLAFDQASVFVLGLVVFCLTITFLRDYHVLERYRYLIAIAGILLLMAPRLFAPDNGAYLAVDLGGISFQTAELAKLCIVVFLASYLAENREMLSVAARRVPRADDPAPQAFRPTARRLGRCDVHADLHPRSGQLADVLRRVSRAAVCRHGPPLLRARRASRCSPSAPTRWAATSRTSTTGSRSGWTRSRTTPQTAPARFSSRCSPRRTAVSSARASASRC